MGKQNSLLLLLDIGTSNSPVIEKKTTKAELTEEAKSVDMEMSNEDKTSARIYVQTLSENSHFGAGSYSLSALKHMVGSSSFMEFPDAIKKCQTETLEECHYMNYFEKLKEQCQCVPWNLHLLNPIDAEVILFSSGKSFFLSSLI